MIGICNYHRHAPVRSMQIIGGSENTGATFEIVCWTHHESEQLGSLHEWSTVVDYFIKHKKVRIPLWLPKEYLNLILTTRAFMRRHHRCKDIALINDLMDIEDAYFMKTDYKKRLPSQKAVKEYVEKCRGGWPGT